MLPSPVYQPPVSNIAYHVYNPEDDLERVQAVSQRAFQRIMDSYTENERLADLFQVEHDKQQKLVRERKEREKLLKQQQKKQSKRQGQYLSRSQDRTFPLSTTPFERQSFRRFPRNTTTPVLNPNPNNNNNHHLGTQAAATTTASTTATALTTAAITEKAEELRDQSAGSLKRARRLSDISNSDISGLGDDDTRSLPPSTSSPAKNSTASRSAGLGIHLADSNERSISSSPALPPTPPRDSPSHTSQAGKDGTDHSSNQVRSTGPSSLAASTTSSSSFAVPNLPQHQQQLLPSGTSRRKRKQAIPVHPSVVERIPGITIRIQRERQGDQLEVEILKTLDDYEGPQSGNEESLSPALKLQAKQDIRKVRESIDSGRPGYAYFSPVGVPGHTQQQPSTTTTTLTTDCANRSLDWSRSLPGSLSSLTWTSSNTDSTENLTAMQDLIDARSMPLSWENFATRECVVNKLVGKPDKDLNTLEEVVQDAIARQQYALQLQHEQEELERLRAQSLTPVDSHRGLSVGFTGSDNGIIGGAITSHPSSSSRASRSVAALSMRTRSTPARATRSKAQVLSRDGKLVAHEDIENHLKEKRRRQREKQHQRQSSRTSSKEGEDDEDDDDDDDKRDSSRRTTHDGDDTDDGESEDHSLSKGAKRKYTKRNAARRNHKQDDNVPTSESSSDDDDERDGKGGRKRYNSPRHRDADDNRTGTSRSLQKKTFKQVPRPDRKGSEPIRRNKKFWSRGRNSRKEDEVDDTGTGESGSEDDEDHNDDYEDVPSTKKASGSTQTRIPESWLRKEPRTKRPSDPVQPTTTWKPTRAFRRLSTESDRPNEDSEADGSDADGTGANPAEPKNQKFAKTLTSAEKAKFFNSAVELIHRKNLEMLESRRKGSSRAGLLREARSKEAALKKEKDEEKEKELELEKEKELELEKEKELQESRVKLEVRLVEESKAQKVESTNLPRSSKSLPGRVLRRAAAGGSGSGSTGGEDPDCTSCRLELSAAEKDAWKLAQEKGEIRLPKTWGTHAILCVACRNQYLGHHSRCTACFYVPVEEEMETSGKRCSRCKAGTWLTEMVQRPPGASAANDDKNRRRRQASDMSL
ncbi:hypothetical protein BG015_002537 [Linnemannia schmuckeri]|uniref:Uncharacterized protein n=1 Tax=Linnemannia schmuckeri TaxID=64567 RepID=A0A9P5V6D3_9FUNG|nr:hypothetical protein BG015_002537 [Linnemannia schmuckeri]